MDSWLFGQFVALTFGVGNFLLYRYWAYYWSSKHLLGYASNHLFRSDRPWCQSCLLPSSPGSAAEVDVLLGSSHRICCQLFVGFSPLKICSSASRLELCLAQLPDYQKYYLPVEFVYHYEMYCFGCPWIPCYRNRPWSSKSAQCFSDRGVERTDDHWDSDSYS